MQNLLLKSLVLTGVIGGSCSILWIANESLNKTAPETDPTQFAALETAEPGADGTSDESELQNIDLSSSEGSTVPQQTEEDGPQPTLAVTDGVVPISAPNQGENNADEPMFLPNHFEAEDDASSSAGPNRFPAAVATDSSISSESAPVMPLTFYSAGGNEVPKVALAFNEESSEKENSGAILPVAGAEAQGTSGFEFANHNEPSSVAEPVFPPHSQNGLKEQGLAQTEIPSLRFGPSTKESADSLSAPLPGQMEEDKGVVTLAANDAAPVLLPPTALNAAELPEYEDASAATAMPILPIHKSETFGANSAGQTTGPAVAKTDETAPGNPFAKYANGQNHQDMTVPSPSNATVVQTSGEVEPTSGIENPFAKFRNPPVRTAEVETVEPSEIGFNAAPPQPSVPTVANDPFATNHGSNEIMPIGNLEPVGNVETVAGEGEVVPTQPVPEELLPPIDPTAFGGDVELERLPVLPETPIAEAEGAAVFPAASPALPAMVEPTPLPVADAPAVSESADVFPAKLPEVAPVESNINPFPAREMAPTIAETKDQWPAEFEVTPPPLSRNVSEAELAPNGGGNLAEDDVFPNGFPERPSAPATFGNVEPSPANTTNIEPAPTSIKSIDPSADVMPLEFGNEPTLEPAPAVVSDREPAPTPMAITPRNSAMPVVNQPTVSESAVKPEFGTFEGPAKSGVEFDYDRSISSKPQSPELKIEKIAPPQASIGEPLIYAIRIQNVGGSDALSVMVEDRIPRGTRLEGTIPQAVLTNDKLKWDLGKLAPGEERMIQLKVIPLEAGDIGSVATVSFEAAVAATIRVTAPELSVDIDGPTETLLGKNVPYKFTVKNTGQGDAKDVVLRAVLPPSLKHPNGNDIEASLNDIPAGESRTVELVVVADDVGVFTPKVLIWMNGKDVAENRADLRILESRLRLSRTGPKRRFVGRPAEFVTQVTNDSSIVLTNVTVEESLPISLDPATQVTGWDPQRRVIQHLIPALQPGETRQFSTQVIPNQAGELTGQVTAKDQAGNQIDLETPLSVKGFADLAVDIYGENKFVVVGDQVSFRLNLKNDGTATANNVQAEFEIPQGLQFAAATGPSAYQVVGNKVQFAAVEQIPVNTEKSYDIVLTAAEVCNTKVKIALHSAEYSEPINREEPVRVVSDSP